MRLRRAIAAALLAGGLAVPVAAADPPGKTTLEETVRGGSGAAYNALSTRPGESYVVRRGPSARASKARARKRRSLAFFGQLTDPQIVDEMSPARVDFVDPAGGTLKSSWRPQEALGPYVFDAVVRNLRANRVSRVRARSRFARLRFAITTGDLADNQQLNETRWFTRILDGGLVDPMSGRPVGPGNPCGSADAAAIARLDADVAARRYTGMQDFDDWRPDAAHPVPADRFGGFWDPDEAAPGLYAAFPRYPGLMDRAQQPFGAAGLGLPWFVARGNHDGLIQGNAPASNPLFRAIATGCDKVFPSDAFDPADFRGKDEQFLYGRLSDTAFLGRLLAGARKVPPDPERRILSKAEYKREVGGNGFQAVSKRENRASKGTASYYAISPARGFTFIALDTVAEGGGQNGNLDDPQYRWLEKQLKAARKARRLVIAFGHHPMTSMTNANTDEGAGKCTGGNLVGCDVDPRRSTPIHRGLVGRKTVRDLFLKYGLLAYVTGHVHRNQVELYKKGRRAFWEIATASHVDWPHESRTIEVMDNRDGTLSLFGTLIDSDAPVRTPASGTPAGALTSTDLAAIARELAWNDPQRAGLPESGESPGLAGEGTRRDRNVELVIRDPRKRR